MTHLVTADGLANLLAWVKHSSGWPQLSQTWSPPPRSPHPTF